MQNQRSARTLFPDVQKAQDEWGKTPGCYGSCPSAGEKPVLGLLDLCGLGSARADPLLPWLPGEPLPRWGGEIHQEAEWPPDQPWRLASPQAGLGEYLFKSLTHWALRSPANVRASAWSPSLQPLSNFLTPWSPLPSLGPNGNNKTFSSKKKDAALSLAEGTSLIPGQGTKISHTMWHGQKKKKPKNYATANEGNVILTLKL